MVRGGRRSRIRQHQRCQERREFQGHIINLSALQMFKEVYHKTKEVIGALPKKSFSRVVGGAFTREEGVRWKKEMLFEKLGGIG